ncbi:MAG TPA: ATP-binding protein, partial [Caulobacteraceae bacterium]|nr:ATP-binding protein [Caulobacteraceae bacterium]
LVVNARDAMPEGGVISLSAENVTLKPGQVAEDLKGEFVAVSVTDTGQGIPADILPRIFDPFFTTKEVGKGTGLGLSQVYGFSQQSGGRATVRSQLGQGTTFTLYLPRVDAEAEAATASEDVDAVEGAKILVVEDNPEVADTAVGLLEQLGHRVNIAGNAVAALKSLEQDPPDLVFTDIVMAGPIDGLGLARQLRKHHPDMPILLATGYSQALEGTGHEFPVLRKPYKLPELSRAVNTLLTRPSADNLVPLEAERRRRRAAPE